MAGIIRLHEISTKRGLIIQFSIDNAVQEQLRSIGLEPQDIINQAVQAANPFQIADEGGNKYLSSQPANVLAERIEAAGISMDMLLQTTKDDSPNIRSTEAEVLQRERIASDRSVFTPTSDPNDFSSPFFSDSQVVGTLNPFTLTATKSAGLEPNKAVDDFFARPDLFVQSTRGTGTSPATATFFDAAGNPTNTITSLEENNGSMGGLLFLGLLALALRKR